MMPDAKTIRENQLLAERGVALITEIVLKMGYIFRPTTVFDGGIDGEIELRNTETGAISNQIIKVQSKATGKFTNETDVGFDFWPSAKDVKYWLGGNVPVILVVSRPDTNEAYWVSVQEYKNANPTSKGIHFDKATMRLNDAAAALASLVKNSMYGRYTPPVQRMETLLSNLLPVTALPEYIYIGETEYRERAKLIDALKEQTTANFATDWMLKNERIFSFRNLREFPYSKICEQGTVDEIPTREWSESTDTDKQRELVQLLNCALREKLRAFGIAFANKAPFHSYYFRGNRGLKPVTFAYFADQRNTSREVFKFYPDKRGKSNGYCRHSAFRGQFVNYDGQWYLEVTPTYYFTRDGVELYRYYATLLSGIKRLELNNAVRGQLVMWIELLTMAPDMLRPAYPYLSLGRALEFSLPVAINDADWRARQTAHAEMTGDDSPLASLQLT